MNEVVLSSSGLTYISAARGDEGGMARTHLESFIDGYSIRTPELFISPFTTDHFTHTTRFERRKGDHWGEAIRGEIPDSILDQEIIVAKAPGGTIMGIGHAAVVSGAAAESHITLNALYLRSGVWGKGAGSEMHNLVLGRLVTRHPEISEARTCIAPYGSGWRFYNRPVGENGEAAWKDLGTMPAEECGGFFGTYMGVPALHRMRRNLITHPIIQTPFSADM